MASNETVFDKIPKKAPEKCDILNVSKIPTPLGDMMAIADDSSLYILQFADGKKIESSLESIKLNTSKELLMKDNKLLTTLKQEMEEYFAGKLKEFKTPVKYFGTDFQKESWSELYKVKYGETLSYSQLASRIGKGPAHSRAIGACAGANPLVIIIPCHRLIASHGKTGGFSCGLDRKMFLLNHEKKFC